MEISDQGKEQQAKQYQAEFQKSVTLFESSFKNLQKSKISEQKKQYVKVMNEALNVMKDSANGMLSKKLSNVREDLNKEFQTYLKDPNDKNAVNLQQEINTVKGIDAESSSES